MARTLEVLLGVDSPVFTHTINNLERQTDRTGIDTRLLGDILAHSHSTMRIMGLDPGATTAEELYYALIAHDDDPELFARTQYAGLVYDGQVISLNYEDIVKNKQRAFAARQTGALKRHLLEELIDRYGTHSATDRAKIEQTFGDAGLKRTKTEKKMDIEDTNAPYILAVGDIITDAFIKLDEDYAKESTDKDGYHRLSFELGAKLPYDSVEIVEAVECSPNAAVSMTRLGLRTSLMSWLGDDEPGKSMMRYLEGQHVGTNDLVVEKDMKSNYHYVLRYGADRTKLQKFEEYSYKWQEPATKPDWLYLGVLGEKTWPLHQDMLRYLDKNPDVKLAFQPGMYHLMWGAEKLKDFYKRADIVILNREEAAQVTAKSREDVSELLDAFHDMGVKNIVITDGGDGAYASDGSKKLFMANYPDPKKPLDRTGAGDAFASTLTAALAFGESLETAMTWAPINSMSVVQKMGAQTGLINQKELKKYLADAPKDYKVKELK